MREGRLSQDRARLAGQDEERGGLGVNRPVVRRPVQLVALGAGAGRLVDLPRAQGSDRIGKQPNDAQIVRLGGGGGRLGKQVVASEDRNSIADNAIERRLAAAGIALIHDVVVDQSRGME